MIGKRKHIRLKIRRGKGLNPRKLAGCDGKIRYEKVERWLENRALFIFINVIFVSSII